MNKLKITLFIVGSIIGLSIGLLISKQLFQCNDECIILQQENQLLRDMLFDQQDPYRPDTTSQPKEVEGCEL